MPHRFVGSPRAVELFAQIDLHGRAHRLGADDAASRGTQRQHSGRKEQGFHDIAPD
ncbi:MAG: hypothetical protein K8T25_21520 [Planctomycetia bacterium]|nr:hypothetical protein [Planctomycetia bacterium]